MASITGNGTPMNTIGELPAVGRTAPPFRLTATDLSDRTLEDFRGRRKLLYVVPSLDTSVCAASAGVFNERAAGSSNAAVLVISADLPFAQKRFLDNAGLESVTALSLMRGKNFAKEYGLLITDGPLAGLCARAVIVLDESDEVIYTELVPEISQEPDYDRALAALG